MIESLSWQEVEDLTGWLCFIRWRWDSKNTGEEYCIITNETKGRYIGKWSYMEDDLAVHYKEYSNVPIDKEKIVSISPIRKIF